MLLLLVMAVVVLGFQLEYQVEKACCIWADTEL